MTVPTLARDIMETKLITLTADMDLHDAAQLLVRNRISGAPVLNEDGTLEGLLTEKDLMTALIDAVYDELPSTKVSSYMNREPYTISEDLDLLSVAQLFQTHPFRRLLVVRDGRLMGLVSRRDVLKSVIKLIEPAQDHNAAMLYLSALRDNNEGAPFG